MTTDLGPDMGHYQAGSSTYISSEQKPRSILSPLKYLFVSACLNLGFSVGVQTKKTVVRDLIAKLHPLDTEHPLIRLGTTHGDGGYLVPDDLDGIVACFSPGIDIQASFENSLIERGIPCFLADASVAGAPIKGDMVHFTKKFLGGGQ